MTADALIATLRTERGALAAGGVEADNLLLDDPAEEGQTRVRKVVLNVRPDARTAGAYQVSFDALALTLPRPVRSFEVLGQNVPTLRAAMVVTHGAALMGAAPGDPLGPWREAGGRVRFEGLILDWGPLQTTGSGEGGLVDANRTVPLTLLRQEGTDRVEDLLPAAVRKRQLQEEALIARQASHGLTHHAAHVLRQVAQPAEDRQAHPAAIQLVELLAQRAHQEAHEAPHLEAGP